MRLRMIQDFKWSPDGISVLSLHAGESVEVPDEVGERWVKERRAEEDKMIDIIPETMRMTISDEKKAKAKRRK